MEEANGEFHQLGLFVALLLNGNTDGWCLKACTLGWEVCVEQENRPQGEQGIVWREDNLCNMNDFIRYVFVGSLLPPVNLTGTTIPTLICSRGFCANLKSC